MVHPTHRALSRRIEGADGVDLVTPEIEAIGIGSARGENIEQPTPAADLSRHLDDGDALVADPLAVAGQLRQGFAPAHLDLAGRFAELPVGERALHEGPRGGHDQGGRLIAEGPHAMQKEAGEDVQAVGDGLQRPGRALVGQDTGRRKGEHVPFGGEPSAQSLAKAPALVARRGNDKQRAAKIVGQSRQ